MLAYPAATSRQEKLDLAKEIVTRLQEKFGDTILAIGIYGSLAQGTDGPFSDLEMHVVTKNGSKLPAYEFILGEFKVELTTVEKGEFFTKAKELDDSWAIKAGAYIKVIPLYDPHGIFTEVKELPLQISQDAIRDIMREFMIWEPYETMGKLRNNYRLENFDYIPLAAKDLVWQTTKLVGLANKNYFSTRARTLEEALIMSSKPSGYEELVRLVMAGRLDDKKLVYECCEKLWSGLNEWFDEIGIDYRLQELPF
ncbi:MAG: KNTase domain-containing protein [Bacillus sp. (in: Bacteria)]|nr:KNTase domain-containing protein [Bacillus sp. (in: firmicutes)]